MISRIFPCKFSANSLDFRFRSLHALHIQNLWNCCRHYLVNFTNFLNLIFGGVFLFSPTVQPQPRTADSHDGLYRRVRGWPARGLQSSAGQCSVSAATELWHAFKVFFSTLSLLFFYFFFAVLDLSVDNDLLLAERQMQAMAKVLHKLICDGTYACISHRLDKKSEGF